MPERDHAEFLAQEMSRATGFPNVGFGFMDGSHIKGGETDANIFWNRKKLQDILILVHPQIEVA